MLLLIMYCSVALFLLRSYAQLYLVTMQTPRATAEVKELKVDISKDGGSKHNLFVKLHILPISVYAIQMLSGFMEKPSASFNCEEFSLSCEFGHDRYFFSFWNFLYSAQIIATHYV